MKRRSVLALAMLLSVAFATDVSALDKITRKSGSKPLSGKITAITKDSVTIKPSIPASAAPVTVPAGDIASVVWDGEKSTMIIARGHDNGGRFAEAITAFEAEIKTAGTNLNFKTDLSFLVARAMARQAMADPKVADAAIGKLEVFRKANANSFRLYEALGYLGELYLRKNDTAKATAIFDEMLKAKATDVRMAAKNSSARALLMQDDVAGALAAYEAVVKSAASANAPTELSRKYEALLGKATCQQKLKQYDDAVTSLEEVIASVSPQDTLIQAEAYIRQGDCLQAQEKPKEALLAYLHVDVLFSSHTALHAEALYHLATLWNSVGKKDRAKDAADRLARDYPNSEWKAKLGTAEG